MTSSIRVAFMGAGGMTRHHIRQMSGMQSTARSVAFIPNGRPVETLPVAMGRLVSGGLVPPTPVGRRSLPVPPSAGYFAKWKQFLEVRSGRIHNPSPPEVGLRIGKVVGRDTVELGE